MKLDVCKNYEIKLNGHMLLFNLKHFYGDNKEAISLFTEVITRLNVKPEENTHLGEKPKYSDPIFIIVNALIHENLYLDSLLQIGNNKHDIELVKRYIDNMREISNLDKFKCKYEILSLDREDLYGYMIRRNQVVQVKSSSIKIPIINVDRARSIANKNISLLGSHIIDSGILNKMFSECTNDKGNSRIYVKSEYSEIIMENDYELALLYIMHSKIYETGKEYNLIGFDLDDAELNYCGIECNSFANLQITPLSVNILKRKISAPDRNLYNKISSILKCGDIDKVIHCKDSIELSIYGESYTYLKTKPIYVKGERGFIYKVYEILDSNGARRYYLPSFDELEIFESFDDGKMSDMEQLLLNLNLDSASIVDKVNG